MPVIGFDDEQVRDAWVEEEVRRAVWLTLEAGPVQGTVGTAMEEAFRPLIEAVAAIVEAVLEEVKRVWELIEAGREEPAGRYRRPRHVNCRCEPPVLVDPVRAGRTRWWTRK